MDNQMSEPEGERSPESIGAWVAVSLRDGDGGERGHTGGVGDAKDSREDDQHELLAVCVQSVRLGTGKRTRPTYRPPFCQSNPQRTLRNSSISIALGNGNYSGD